MSKQKGLKFWLSMLALLAVASCAPRDETIKADLTVKAKESLDFAGVRFTVESGVVTLMGDCPTSASRAAVYEAVKRDTA